MTQDTFVSGTWNVICDQCGRKFKANQVRKRWDGFIVCSEDYELRNPQDFVRPVPDATALPFVRAEPDDQFVSVTYISSTIGTQENTIPNGTFDSVTIDDDQYHNIVGDQGGGILVE